MEITINPFTPWSDYHATSNPHENTQPHQVQFITLIEHLILLINSQGNV